MKLSIGRIILGLGWLGGLLGLTACEEEQPKKELRAESRGEYSQVVVILTKRHWENEVGDSLRAVMAEPIPGIPQDEPRFKLIYVAPGEFGRFLKTHNNILMLTALDDTTTSGKIMKNFFTTNSLKTISQDEAKMIIPKSNEFAKGQKSLFVFGRNEVHLVDNLMKNRDKIIEYFQKADRERMLTRVLSEGATEQKKMGALVQEATNLELKIPARYLLAKKDSNFMWLRMMGEPDKSILITYGEYTNPEMFDDENIVKWRNHFGFKSMQDPDKDRPNSYMESQHDQYPIYSRRISQNGMFAVEYRGLWRLHNKTRGGPFIGYAFVDEKNKRFYYIEGFVYAPNLNKRKPLLELEAILRTFKITKSSGTKS
ncbi:MAG: DUF4837 family protein [Microscillaceae bacterium]|jgi:hypothetical protein|nr:DUF4837 family protein [Microscillaceae bacterium]